MRVSSADVLKDANLLADIIKSLQNGELIVYPTDTVYGLGCDALNSAAIEKLYNLKQKKRQFPVSIVCTDMMEVHRHVNIPGFAYHIIREMLPGPYTFIMPLKNPQLKVLANETKGLGVRVPGHPICQLLTKTLGHPIISTSANISGEATLFFPDVIETTFGDKIAYFIEEGALMSDPSSVVDMTKDVPRVLREGKGDVSRFL